MMTHEKMSKNVDKKYSYCLVTARYWKNMCDRTASEGKTSKRHEESIKDEGSRQTQVSASLSRSPPGVFPNKTCLQFLLTDSPINNCISKAHLSTDQTVINLEENTMFLHIA